MQETLFSYPNLTIKPLAVEDLIVKDDRVVGVETADGQIFHTERVVLTTGTFLRGEIHIGHERTPAGQDGHPCPHF